MSTQQIASRLVELCRQQQFEAALQELFSDDAVSIEPHATPMFAKETMGLPAIIAKGRKWMSMVEKIHDLAISTPLVAGKAIAVTFTCDITMKERGRIKMEEVGVYQVKDGKIASEQFFM